MSTFDDASLVFIPSGYKTSKAYSVKPIDGSGDLTFTRSNDTATRVNSAGLIEKVRTNLILQSNTFSTTWAGSGSSVTSGQSGYDGTSNAWLLTRTGASGFLSQNLVQSTLGVVSVYAKANANSWFRIRVSPSALSSAYYNLSNGTLGTVTSGQTATITSIGNGWYRCTLTYPPTSSDVRFYVADADGDVSGSSGSVFIQSAQWELGDIATPYIPTTTAAVSVGPVANIPRIDYLGGGCGKLLLEPQRTNTILWSEQINTTNWPSSTRINVTANALVSPDGYQNADVIIPNTTSGNHGPAQNISGLTSGATYSCSIYAKAQGYSKFLILAGAGTGSGQYEFDLTAGTAQAGATITSVGNGWYRCTAPLVPNSSLLQYLIFISNGSAYSYAGNGTSGIAFWGAQVELGAYATSYTPTLASASTRGADSCSKTGISSLIGQTEGTLFLSINVPNITSAGTYASHILNDGTSSNQIEFTYYPTGRIQAVAIVGGSVNVNINLTSYGLTAGNHKIAFAYKLNDYVLYVDGAQAGADTSASVPATSVFNLYAGSGSTQVYNQALLFKTRLSNSELAALTTL